MSVVEAQIIKLDEVVSFIKKVPASSFEALNLEVTKTLFEVDATVKSNTALKRRSGSLMRSIKTYTSGESISSYKSGIYSDCVYAITHEQGATIRAKRAYTGVKGGPYLNIPTAENKTAAGVQRMPAKTVFSQGGYVLEYKPNKYGVMLNGTMMFTLHKSVTVPARLGLVSTVEDSVPTLLSRIAMLIGEE